MEKKTKLNHAPKDNKDFNFVNYSVVNFLNSSYCMLNMENKKVWGQKETCVHIVCSGTHHI